MATDSLALRAKAEALMAEEAKVLADPASTDGQKNAAHEAVVAAQLAAVAAEDAAKADADAKAADPMTPSKAGMVRLRIVKPCVISWDDPPGAAARTPTEFRPDRTNCGEPGVYELTEADSKHWYLQHFTDKPPPVTPVPGTQAYADQALRMAADEKLMALAEKQQADAAADQVRTNQRRKKAEAA